MYCQVALVAFFSGLFVFVDANSNGTELFNRAINNLKQLESTDVFSSEPFKNSFDSKVDTAPGMAGKRNGYWTDEWAGNKAYDLDPQRVRFIPPFDRKIHDYNTSVEIKNPHEVFFVAEHVIPLLEQAAGLGNVDAMVTLGDIYTFGNFSIPTNYSKGLQYFEQAVELKSDGHAFFMLGFMYSTGMFGELTSDQAKAQLYYQLGMEAGDINALLALAYRSFKGVGCPRNCDLASVYYTKLAKMGYQFMANNTDFEPTEITYNLKIPDFGGGIYGTELSESPMSVVTSKRDLFLKVEREHDIDDFDKEINLNFFSALDAYDGLYLQEKNYTEAKQCLERCVDYGQRLPGYKDPASMSTNDKLRFSQCEFLLGSMHLKGQGTEVDYQTAFQYLNDSTRFYNTSDSLAELGVIYENGYINDGIPQTDLAMEMYMASRSLAGRNSKYLAKFLMSKVPHDDIISSSGRSNIVEIMKTAATSGDTEAIYLFYTFIQSGYTKGITTAYTCEQSMTFARVFIERLHKFFFPHLKYALLELDKYNYKNALLGYSIAAEQGLEAAQVSAGWLLYQSDTFKMKKDKGFNKQFDSKRLQSALGYFERASDQGNMDATIFLGDIYFNGVESANLQPDYEKSFSFYEKAADSRSPHGSFNLGYMYEHGLGVVDGADYYMAKARYDSALHLQAALRGDTANQIPIYLALLKLRIKHFFFGGNDKDPYGEKMSWFSAFKRIGMQDKQEIEQMEQQEERNQRDQRARQQHENEENSDDEDFGDFSVFGEYFAIGITIVMLFFGLRNTIQQFRRPRQENGAPHEQEGWRANGNGVGFRRGNFEFHFMAL